MRDVPDVSLSGASHDAYLVRSQGTLYAVGGTSASSPAFAGLMGLIVQKTGERQGNANARLYEMANDQYSGSGVTIFHDTTSGSNTIPGVTGYSCTTGYDQATGLGSVIASTLVNNWVPITVTASVSGSTGGTITPATTTVAYGESLTMTLSPSTGYHLTSLTDNGTNVTSSVANNTYTISNITVNHTVIATFAVNSYTVSASVSEGSGTVTPTSATVEYGGSSTFTFAPNPDYSVEDVLLDGTSVLPSLSVPSTTSGDRTYTLTNVTANHTLEVHFVSCVGDVNGDGLVTAVDYGAVKAALGSNPSSPNWNPRADLNGDGCVTVADYSLVKTKMGTSCP
jgi:hypothetical protein